MYTTRRIGNQFYVIDPYGRLSSWFSYNPHEAERKARELDHARAYYFQVEE